MKIVFLSALVTRLGTPLQPWPSRRAAARAAFRIRLLNDRLAVRISVGRNVKMRRALRDSASCSFPPFCPRDPIIG